MEIIGALYQYLLPSMLMGMPAELVWILISHFRKKRERLFLWGIRYVFLTCVAAIVLLTDAYLVFIDGIPQYMMYPNFIPIYTTLQDFKSDAAEVSRQIFDNVVLFVPFGFLLCCSFPRIHWKWWKVMVVNLPFVAIIEILEFFSGRYMDVDDLIINTIGSLIGYIVYKIMENKIQYKNYLSATGTNGF